jgi:branched-chain amino acid aminotransferase
MGLEVEMRHVLVDELGDFEEAGACGTAAIISPIREIYDRDTGETFKYGKGEAGPVSTELYNKLRAIQYGEIEDPYGWTMIIE